MTLLDDAYEFPDPDPGRGPRSRLKPAVALALANPNRAVQVTELGTIGSANARLSGIRKQLRSGVPGQPPGHWDVARDELKIVIRFVPGPDPALLPEQP